MDWCKVNTLQSSSDILVKRTNTGTSLWLASTPNNVTPTTTPASGGGWNYRGVYVAGTTYNTNDVILSSGGISGGMYLSLIDTNLNAYDSGIGWVQVSPSGIWL
jgi:hypothetical protein